MERRRLLSHRAMDTVPVDPTECQCHRHGFCPVHGTYVPAVTDEEILVTMYRPLPRNGRVIRKPLE